MGETSDSPVATSAEQIADAVDAASDDLAQAAEELVEAADRMVDEIAGAPDEGAISHFDHAGARLIVEEHGPDADGHGDTVYLLVHGIGMGRKVFGDLTRLLARDAGVIAIDQPGYGESPEPPRTPTMERTADLVAAFIRERIGRPVVLIGHSMGSQVATEVAVRHPDLLDRLVLAAPTVDRAARSALRQLLRLGRDLQGESFKVLVLGTREYVRAGPNLRRKMRAMLVHRPEDSYPRIGVPTLVLRGENDLVCPREWCAFVAASIPDARLVEVEGHGHETMIRGAGPAAALIREFVAAD